MENNELIYSLSYLDDNSFVIQEMFVLIVDEDDSFIAKSNIDDSFRAFYSEDEDNFKEDRKQPRKSSYMVDRYKVWTKDLDKMNGYLSIINYNDHRWLNK